MQSTTIPAQRRIIEKILSIGELPTYAEAEALLRLFYRKYKGSHADKWEKFCNASGIYNIWNVEFVKTLAEEIRRLGSFPIVEICAGNGKLSYHLRKAGIDIKATDSQGYDPFVEEHDHAKTLKKYKPQVVVASWSPKDRISHDVLDYPTVNHYLHIGNPDMCGIGENVFMRKDFTHSDLRNVEEFSIGMTDYRGAIYHCYVWLFSRK